ERGAPGDEGGDGDEDRGEEDGEGEGEPVAAADEAPEAAPAPRRPLTPAQARRMAAAERVLYGAGGVLTAIGPHLDAWPLHTAALAAGAGTLATLWGRSKSTDAADLLLSSWRALPVLALSGAYTAALVAPGAAWWEFAAPAAAALAALAAPFTRSRSIEHALAPAADVDQAEAQPLTYRDGLRRLWAASPATGDTDLTQIHQPDPDLPDFTAVVLAPPGQAVPATITVRTVAAVFDVPEEAVTVAPVPGKGPGHVALTVAPVAAAQAAVEAGDTDEADEVRALWEDRVSGPRGAAPGMRLVDYRLDADRLVVLVQADDDKPVALPRLPIARALRVEDPDLVMIETDGMSSGVVTVYREHPLIHIREATVEDLTMAEDGTVAIGLQHDGRTARVALYRPELGALTDLLVGAPGSGKSVTLLTLLAAERISGVVSIVADAQDGMSLPEARGRVAHFGAGRAALGATLAAACAVMDYREKVSAANGWGSFTLGEPWALLIVTLDEINKVLAEDAMDVHPDFRKWVAGMIGRFQLTGRKVGAGVRFAGQSLHLADLGDSEKIRANAKQGLVWLGRVNSTMTQRMATDMGSGTAQITPIPATFGAGGSASIAAAWNGEHAPRGPVTAGCAWMIQNGEAVMTRVFRAVKENRTYPGLIALLESAPMAKLTPAEAAAFDAAYGEALPYAEELLVHGKAGAPCEDDEDGGERTARTAPPSRTPSAPATNLRDVILAALTAGPMRTRDIRQAAGCGTPNGPASGSVDNALSKLNDEGLIVRAGHGIWSLSE
ncbi:hypothetical protein, partial [Streptomyces filamentosus]|uniref:hypothetical protein n=1 Tax=Streptomyces filamentosus TaxID=67294 RepID=UPI003319D621